MTRYLQLIETGLTAEASLVDLPSPKFKISDLRQTDQAREFQEEIEAEKSVVLALRFPLSTHAGKKTVELRAVVAKTPYGKMPIDRLFREGMSLPDVKTSTPGDLDLVMLVEDGDLATYLNLCEGKAHLDLLGSKEIKQKLDEKGYLDGLAVRKLVKQLPAELRAMLTLELTKPDESVFESFFSIADADAPPRKRGGIKPAPPPLPPPPPPPPRAPAVRVAKLSDGFRLTANEQFELFPVTVKLTIAYADGSRNPKWSAYDFKPGQLSTSCENCSAEFVNNRLVLRNWTTESSVEVTGFDANRELDLRIRIVKDASED